MSSTVLQKGGNYEHSAILNLELTYFFIKQSDESERFHQLSHSKSSNSPIEIFNSCLNIMFQANNK